MNLNQKSFKALQNSKQGEASDETVFHYHQNQNLIWAEYGGGKIQKGFLVGTITENKLSFNYQHVNAQHKIKTGICNSVAYLHEDGRIILHEEWQWTCGDYSKGNSTLIEVL